MHCPWEVTALISYGGYIDHEGEQVTKVLRDLRTRIVAAGGTAAPMVVYIAVEPPLPRRYAEHLANVWKLDELDEDGVDEDDIPSFKISGTPPRRLQERVRNP